MSLYMGRLISNFRKTNRDFLEITLPQQVNNNNERNCLLQTVSVRQLDITYPHNTGTLRKSITLLLMIHAVISIKYTNKIVEQSRVLDIAYNK